jgi:prophage regulatory protein
MFIETLGGPYMVTKFLRLPEVMARTGLARSTIYKLMTEARFPKSFKICGRATAWLNSDVDAWLSECLENSRSDSELEE